MKCENPIIYKFNGMKTNDSGKLVKDLKFIGHLSELRLTSVNSHFDDPVWLKLHHYVVIPCNRCIICRLRYAKQWADRLILASESVKYKYFLTLTYDDDHLESCKVQMYNNDDDLIIGYSLVKDHIQKFMKRLRKYAEKNNKIDGDHIQYYLCGEYGEKKERPHFHVILFNFIIDDLEEEYVKNCNQYFQSKIITDLWKNGRTQVCNISYETCAYVAGYVNKKVYGKDAADYYASRAVFPEFCSMSRNPAIGRDIYERDKYKIYENDNMLLLRGDKVFDVKPPRYYDKLFDIDEPEKMSKVKLARGFHRPLIHSDKYGYSYLQTQAKNIKARQRLSKGDL